MGFYENGLERVAAVCVGATTAVYGLLPPGSVEVGIGLAGLAGFVLGKHQKFGPECARVRRGIQDKLVKDYQNFIDAEGGDWTLSAELKAAHSALLETLEDCFINRSELAKSAVTPNGFPQSAVEFVMAELGAKRPDLFAAQHKDSLAYKYAEDVVRIGILTAVKNVDYYRSLEPEIMFEMAAAIGEIREGIALIRHDIDELRTKYSAELEMAKQSLQASESDLISLLSFILRKPVARQDIFAELQKSYQKLSDLHDQLGQLRQQARGRPDFVPLLEKVELALRSNEFFSLDVAENALLDADVRFAELFPGREELGYASIYFHNFLHPVLGREWETGGSGNSSGQAQSFVVLVPESFNKLRNLRSDLARQVNKLGLVVEAVPSKENRGSFYGPKILCVNGLLFDVPSPISSSEKSFLYKRISKIVVDSPEFRKPELLERLARLEAIIIAIFFKALRELLDSLGAEQSSRVEFLTLEEFVARVRVETVS